MTLLVQADGVLVEEHQIKLSHGEGPIATFRWDNANNVSIKNLSVREIQPPQ
jgi:hypothetical protein